MQQSIWRTEEKLVDTLEKTLLAEQTEPATRRVKIIREFDPGLGRVDILCVWFDTHRLEQRILHQQTPPLPFSKLCAYVMTNMNTDTWTDIIDLGRKFHLPRARMRKAVEVLVSRDLIEQEDQAIRARSNESIYLIESIDAYEAKLYRWRDAVRQAYLHRWFASSRYIVMPEMSMRVQDHLIEKCTLSDVGAMLYHDEYHSRIPFAPPPSVVPNTHIGWFLNELVFDEECRNATTTPS